MLFDLNFITHQIPFQHHPTDRCGPLWPGHLANIVRLHCAAPPLYNRRVTSGGAAAANNKQLMLSEVTPNIQQLRWDRDRDRPGSNVGGGGDTLTSLLG